MLSSYLTTPQGRKYLELTNKCQKIGAEQIIIFQIDTSDKSKSFDEKHSPVEHNTVYRLI